VRHACCAAASNMARAWRRRWLESGAGPASAASCATDEAIASGADYARLPHLHRGSIEGGWNSYKLHSSTYCTCTPGIAPPHGGALSSNDQLLAHSLGKV
jgi:hypothetical protein